jgi:hypothetical protein
VTPAPLDPALQDNLSASLVGSWHLDAIEDRRGNREPLETARITYHFNEDGTGRYEQIVGMPGADAVNPFRWTLQGANLVLEGQRSKGSSGTFRIEHWSDQQMVWFNYRQSDHFHLQRTFSGVPAMEADEEP